MPQFFDRSAWGALPPKNTPTFVAQESRTHCFLHHSTGDEYTHNDPAEWVRQIQYFHMYSNHLAKGGANDIGYSFLVDRFGNIYEGRGWDVAGGHTKDYNTRGHGICFLGDGSSIEPEDEYAVFNAIRSLFEEADVRAGHPLVRLNHRDVFPTTCPGDELADWLNAGMPLAETTPALAPEASPPPPPLYPQLWDPMMHSQKIAELQDGLNRLGESLVVDGWFGIFTDAALRRFQASKGLLVDGVYGPLSEGALAQALAAPQWPGRYLKLKNPHMQGEDVRVWQKRLIDLGYNLGQWGADGDFGDWTSAATRQFQRDRAIGVDGVVGPVSWRAAWL